MTLGLHQPIPSGSEYHIEYDGPKQKEVITIYLPPVGYTIDRMPDPETGVPSYQLVKCEILGEDLPVEKQKWIKPTLPKDWNKWRDEEKRQQKFNKDFVHPEAEKFRAREWTRRINGCWQALGNRNGKPTEYVYIPPGAYFYFAWWRPDFGSPKFRLVYLKTWLALQWAEDHPLVRGIALSTHRRHGKTSIAACWTFDYPSRIESGYGAMQGQAGKKALTFFDIHLMQPFRRMVEFFLPKYDAQASQKSQLVFSNPPPRSNKKSDTLLEQDNIEPLGGRIMCVSSSETSLDGTKQHRIWLDECFAPGTRILCEGFIFKKIEDINVGEKVITEGGELVEVAQTCEGVDDMFEVEQPYGKNYVVNSKHRLYLELRRSPRATRKKKYDPQILKITPVEYLNLSSYKRFYSYRVTSKGIYFSERSHIIQPYLFGLWLGDGRYGELCIIVNIIEDGEIYNYLRDFAIRNSIDYRERKSTSDKCVYISLRSPVINFVNEFKRLGVFKNKHIPKEYLLDSYENRLQLLAGIIDTDGHAEENYVEIGMANAQLVKDIYDLAGSLGFSVSNIKEKQTNLGTTCYRITISGDLHKIPCLVNRKNFKGYTKKYNSRRCLVKVRPIGVGKYYGITLKTEDDDNRRLIIDDFTISMNCGKWQKVDISTTVTTYVPCTSNEILEKIGLLFVPSTVEDLDQGGEEFIKVFEDSVPSLMQQNPNGTTGTELVSIFISSHEGIVFEEYGRSVQDDPSPDEIVLDESGKQIIYGSKSVIAKRRESKRTEEDRIKEVRKYPTSWFEAKMSATFNCQFNAQILTTRLQELTAMKKMPFIRGNYQWVDEVDGDVEFVRDDISGRFQVAWQPDMEGGLRETSTKIINNVSFEWGEDILGNRVKLWYPRNDQLFACGCDPISYKARGIDPRLSNGAAHIFRKYDDSVDQGKPKEEWETHNFVVQYLWRPDEFEIFAEDMIKLVRYWGVSINAEDNVQALRMHFDRRGYGAFIMYRRDFVDPGLMGNGDKDRPIRSNPEVIDNYTRVINTFFNRHGMRMKFPEPLKQGLQFDPNDTQKYDCIVSMGYTLMSTERPQSTADNSKEIDVINIFPTYDNSGTRSKAV